MKNWMPYLEQLPKIHSVPTKAEMEIIRTADDPIPSYDVTG